jgi:hypothetical protein
MLLLRFLDPAAGRILLGGTGITTLAGDDVRRVVGLCAQDAHTFDTHHTGEPAARPAVGIRRRVAGCPAPSAAHRRRPGPPHARWRAWCRAVRRAEHLDEVIAAARMEPKPAAAPAS